LLVDSPGEPRNSSTKSVNFLFEPLGLLEELPDFLLKLAGFAEELVNSFVESTNSSEEVIGLGRESTTDSMAACPLMSRQHSASSAFSNGLASVSRARESRQTPNLMITCPACGHQNIDGTQFCEMCGEELPDASAQTSAPKGNEEKCPNCGHLNPPENLACEACGANLRPAAAPIIPIVPVLETTPFDAPLATPIVPVFTEPQAAGDLKPGLVKLVVEQGQSVGAQFILNDAQIEVGREDEDEGIYPDIDLSDQDAGYVHRRHATLAFDNGHLMVTHLGGANKTRVNNKPVADGAPTEVKLGDKVAFGKVVLRLMPV